MLDKMTTFVPLNGAPDPAANQFAHFWGEVSPSEHLVQIYHEDGVFLDSLEGFVAGGIKAGDGVIVIATPAHLAALEHRLQSRRIGVETFAAADQYIALNAKEMLSKFMVDDPVSGDKNSWPDADRFHALVNDVILRAGARSDGTPRRVRAFGEMVALLWADGKASATFRLEYLWHDFCRKSGLCLFCAYPRAYFTNNPEASIKQICAAHSQVVSHEHNGNA
jgi:hypothetical protein